MSIVSLIIPGLGQVLAREIRRGIILFVTFISVVILLTWRFRLAAPRDTGWINIIKKAFRLDPILIVVSIFFILLYLWIAYDAYLIAKHSDRTPMGVFAMIFVMFFGLGWQIGQIDLIALFTQLDDAGRGFSFREDGPLDMRMDPRLTKTAADLINGLKERELSDLLYYNAQEMASRRISKRICAVRREGRITTTARLARIIADAVGVDPDSRKAKIHPATRIFMALRMAVNDEIPCLKMLLEAAPDFLSPGGRLGIIAFHSVEDKAVKIDFRQRKAEGIYDILTKKPIVACAEERRGNPRSRSAKLRVAVRLGEN